MATNILERVREGMSVCGPDGSEIGKVEMVHFTDENPADPGAGPATVSGSKDEKSLFAVFADAFRSDGLPQPLQERLLRHGFVRVDSSRIFGSDRYVFPDQIASVSGDRVTLTVGDETLVKRG